jgi:hypothetical protein
MRILEMLIVVLSALVVFGFLCRLDALRFNRHSLKVIFFHVALFASAAGAGFSAFQETLSLKDLAGLAASALWLWISIPSWRHGPPSHVTKPMPLEPLDFPRIIGGKNGNGP